MTKTKHRKKSLNNRKYGINYDEHAVVFASDMKFWKHVLERTKQVVLIIDEKQLPKKVKKQLGGTGIGYEKIYVIAYPSLLDPSKILYKNIIFDAHSAGAIDGLKHYIDSSVLDVEEYLASIKKSYDTFKFLPRDARIKEILVGNSDVFPKLNIQPTGNSEKTIISSDKGENNGRNLIATKINNNGVPVTSFTRPNNGVGFFLGNNNVPTTTKEDSIESDASNSDGTRSSGNESSSGYDTVPYSSIPQSNSQQPIPDTQQKNCTQDRVNEICKGAKTPDKKRNCEINYYSQNGCRTNIIKDSSGKSCEFQDYDSKNNKCKEGKHIDEPKCDDASIKERCKNDKNKQCIENEKKKCAEKENEKEKTGKVNTCVYGYIKSKCGDSPKKNCVDSQTPYAKKKCENNTEIHNEIKNTTDCYKKIKECKDGDTSCKQRIQKECDELRIKSKADADAKSKEKSKADADAKAAEKVKADADAKAAEKVKEKAKADAKVKEKSKADADAKVRALSKIKAVTKIQKLVNSTPRAVLRSDTSKIQKSKKGGKKSRKTRKRRK